MKLAKLTLGLLLAALCFMPMRVSAAPAYACSIAEIFECTPVAGCQRVSAQQANLPPFVTLNVKEGRLFSGCSTNIGHFLRAGRGGEDRRGEGTLDGTMGVDYGLLKACTHKTSPPPRR